jgi:hypothetical protein
MFNSPTTIFCPVIDEFLAISINACAVSSKSVYAHQQTHPQTQHHNQQNQKEKPTTFFNHALSSSLLTPSSPYNCPHSVKSKPGRTALTLTLGPCVAARQRMRCSCAAFVTLYGMLEPPGLMPAIELVTMKDPPSGFALKVANAARSRCV